MVHMIVIKENPLFLLLSANGEKRFNLKGCFGEELKREVRD